MDDLPKPIYPPLMVPVMTREQFALSTGLGDEVVRGLIDKGHLPSVKLGRHRLVNVALLTLESYKEVWEK